MVTERRTTAATRNSRTERRHVTVSDGDFGPGGRRGGFLVEMLSAVVVLSAALLVAVPMIGKTGALRRQAEQRQLAMQEAANLMEQVARLPWQRLSKESLQRLKLSEAARRGLRSPELVIELAEPVGPVPTKQVVIQVRWRDSVGRPIRPVWLVAWFYDRGGK